MDFVKLSKVTLEIQSGKKIPQVVDGRSVEEVKNPLDEINTKEKITDTEKVIVIDSTFIKKLKSASRETKRKFLSRLTDSQRKRVLTLLKVKDSSASQLGFITFDTLLSNYKYDPSELNKKNIEEFLEYQSYFEYTDALKELVEAVLEGKENLPEEGMTQLIEGLEGAESRLAAFSGDLIDVDIPDEEELTEEDIETLKDSARLSAFSFKKENNVRKMLDSAEDLLTEFQGKNRSYSKSSKVYWDEFDKAWEEQCANEQKEIKDALDLLETITDDQVIDKIYEGPTIENGEEVKDVEERSIVQLFVEALESYSEGDPEKLDTLLDQSIGEVDESDTEEPEEPEEEEEVEEFTEEEEEKIKDAFIHLSKRLKQGKSINKLVDALSKVCPKLQDMNLKKGVDIVCDSTIAVCDDVIADPPLTHAEYCATHACDIPPVVACALGEQKPIVWPFKEWCVDGDCINCDGRYYRPYTCTAEEVAKRLEEAEDDPTRIAIVGSTSVPLSTFRKVASRCDALNLIDRRFYRPSMLSDSWKFNGDLKEILDQDIEGTTLRRSNSKEGTIEFFGYPYVVV